MTDSTLLIENVNKKIEADIEARIKRHQDKIRRVQQAESITRFRSASYTAIAIGDSWFDYPLVNDLFIGQSDIIAQLELMHDHEKLILNLAHYGDATTDMMSQAKQQRLIRALSDQNNWPNGKPDVIFCSAGGNDVAGNQFANFLNFNDGVQKGLNSAKFEIVLNVVRLNYETLFDLRDRYAPGVRIFAHTYDFPTPDGRHPSCAGPWLYPSLKSKNWSVLEGKKIVAKALKKFRTMLKELESDSSNKFSVIDTQGTLTHADYSDDWTNELHPTERAFKQLARKFDPFWVQRLQEDRASENVPVS